MKCLRCSHELVRRGVVVLSPVKGLWGEISLDVQECPECKHVEFFRNNYH